MPTIKINDIKMYYELQGKGETVVFIAGFSVDNTAWASVVDLFKPHYQVLLFDNRGAGQTEVPNGPYSIDGMADDTAELCAALGIKRAHFVGSSMGGFILQSLAYRYPDLVRSACFSNSSAYLKSCFHIFSAAQLELMRADAPKAALIKASCSWTFSYQFLEKDGMLEGLIELGLKNPYPFTIKAFEAQFAAIHAFDSRAWLKDIQVPCLVLGSDQDIIIPAAAARSLANQIPGALYCQFDQCGHLPQMEYPTLFFKVVQNFMTDYPYLP